MRSKVARACRHELTGQARVQLRVQAGMGDRS